MPRPIEPVGPICVATAAAVAEAMAVALGATAVTVDDGEAVVDGLGFTIPVVVAVGLETLVAVRVGIAVAVNVLVGLGTAVEVAVAFLAARGSAADAPVAGKRARTRPTAQSATIVRGCENGERVRFAGRREEIMMMSRFALHGLTRSHLAG